MPQNEIDTILGICFMGLQFKIIKKCWQNAKKHTETDVDFFLEENDWNDFGFQTTYFLHASSKFTGKEPVCLGGLRIMRKGQRKEDCYLLNSMFRNNIFACLPEGFLSLSMDVDLYIGLNRWLNTEESRKEVISALRMILSKESEYFDESLYSDECFMTSLLRDGSNLENFALKKGRTLLTGSECFYDLRKEIISIKYSHIENELELKFNCVEEDVSSIPNGILVFIGKNGSGKSTAIYKLAKLIYCDPTQRFRMKEKVGELKPSNIGVSKMFLISYSPFDNFVLPTSYDKNYKKLLEKKEDVKSRFVFSGIRKLEEEQMENSDGDEGVEHLLVDRRSKTSLKDISSLANEFVSALDSIIIDSNERKNIWDSFVYQCSIKQPSLYEDIRIIDKCLSKDRMKEIYLSLSTGHKFFLHSYVRLLAYIEDNSLVLFDEPENHLHPPLLSFLISSMRILLHKYKSVIFIATHSPVILQETFTNNVFVVRKQEGVSTISHPNIETYGANLSSIISEVFDLTTSVTEYHDTIKFLYNKWNMKWKTNVKEMLLDFEDKLGHTLSDQLATYLINLYTKYHDVEN